VSNDVERFAGYQQRREPGARCDPASPMITADYAERVYAGVLGKIIGVYLGRPFEQWTHERIVSTLGEINYYVNHRYEVRKNGAEPLLVVTDDDISGTFTFVRALPDYGNSRQLTPAQIGETWLNYVVEERSTHWWGGFGLSAEHTAFLRLKAGMRAPHTGSSRLNGKVLSEQIGAQIFIDGWAMVAPGDPEFAADLARRAASVSHDGEAVVAAQVIAAMESAAFLERDVNRLIDTAVALIPADSVISRMIDDIRGWHARDTNWRATRSRIAEQYGYDKYRGNCHVVPNHALIINALLHGEDDFQRSLMIVNTSGWDTDCNSGNLGCLLGIKNGLPAIDTGPDWRGPIADRLYLSTADGGRAITDAGREATFLAGIGRALAGQPAKPPKDGARFHFDLPGSVQGFHSDDSLESNGTTSLENVAGHSRAGSRSLAIHYRHLASGRVGRVETPTFVLPETARLTSYPLLASPTLYAGQTVRARVEADRANEASVSVFPFIRFYDGSDALTRVTGQETAIEPGEDQDLVWRVQDTGGQPIAAIGVELGASDGAFGTLYLDYLNWDGPPQVTLTRPLDGGTMWRRAWVQAVDRFDPGWPEPYRLIQNSGCGLLIQGTREWTDYRVAATVKPEMIRGAGIAARVQGLRRYYALVLGADDRARLIKELDGTTVLAEAPVPQVFGRPYQLALEVEAERLQGSVDGELLFDVVDPHLVEGSVAFLCDEGCMTSDSLRVGPLESRRLGVDYR
jgi:ADP-ribosylglycohydrolase